MNRQPTPYIQNHINWCWATTAYMVALDYCQKNGITPYISKVQRASYGIIRQELTGLRSQFCGKYNRKSTVDSIQFDIVTHAKSDKIQMVIFQKVTMVRNEHCVTLLLAIKNPQQ